jgi:tripartite-type tricarboxylate transporter receptor subunit TctC
MRTIASTAALTAILGLSHAFAFVVHAQTAATGTAAAWPTKPIRMLIPYPAGGTSDILARLIGPKLTEAWGPQIIVDNRVGAGGNIAMELTSRSPPDGYTLVLNDLGNFAISPSVYTKLPFDIVRDFTPVAMISYSPHMVTTHPNVPVKSVRELISLAKKNPGKLNVPVGLGSAVHLAALALEQKAGTNWVYVPTKGGQASIMTLATGEGDFLFMGVLQTLPHVKNGRIKAIAVSSEKREAALPNVPTVQETPGLEGFVTGTYQGIMGPAKMPADIVAKINAEVRRVQGLPDIREKLGSQSTTPLIMSPQELGKWLANEKERWAQVIKTSGFKIE